MPRERARGDREALAEMEDWGQGRQKGLPGPRRPVALPGRHGIVGPETGRASRSLVVARCHAIATGHGLDMMDYGCRDGQSGPLASLMGIGLHAVEPDGADTERVFDTDADEREFLEGVRGRGHAGPGRMARDAVMPGRERMTIA